MAYVGGKCPFIHPMLVRTQWLSQCFVCTIRGSNSNRADYFVLQNVQTDCGAHSDSYSMGVGSSFPPVVNRQGRAASHSHPFTAKVGNWWTSTSTLPVPSRRGHKFAFTLLTTFSKVTKQEINTQRKRSCRVRSGNSTHQ